MHSGQSSTGVVQHSDIIWPSKKLALE